MKFNEIFNGDLIVAKRSPSGHWVDPASDGSEIELVIAGGPYLISGRIIAVCEDGQIEESFDLDDHYIQDNCISKKWLGWSACPVAITKVSRVVHRPKSIGDNLSLSCSILNGIIYKINQPNEGNCTKQFEIIGRMFNKSAWQYEYAVKIPHGSTAGIVLTASDLEDYSIEDTSLVGCLFQGVLTSEITMSSNAPPRGMSCMNRYCQTFCPWVDDPNCPNGVFLCYSCKTNPITYEIVMSKFSTIKE